MRRVAWALALVTTGNAWSAELNPIPEEPGLSGNLGLGVTYFSVESNFITGNRLVSLDNETVDDLQAAPGSESAWSPTFQIDLRYTLSNQRSQWFIGNALQDLVRLDLTQQIGFRHKLDGWGTPSLSYVFSSVPTEVYADPFLTGEPRATTDRDSNGFRLGWDNIGDSPLGFTYTQRDIDIDDERAGQSLLAQGRLDQSEQSALRRSGTQHRYELLALFEAGERQLLAPQLFYVERDLDGEANAGDGYGAQLTYSRRGQGHTLVATAAYAVRNYDSDNPVYDRKADADEYGVSGTVILHDVAGWKRWDVLLGLAWYESDSDIDFYDTRVFAANATLLYRFR